MNPPARRFVCPFCGLRIYAEDDKLAISHEIPECARWAEVVVEAKGKREPGIARFDKRGRRISEDS